MLSGTPRNLEGDGLVSRTVYAEVPPRVEYAPAGPSSTSRTSRPAARPTSPGTDDPDFPGHRW
ncbi:winged helix-turn-helix transcriptional regulator [Actinoallomurus iriomotensis]|uniref:winged helix-turn-helix transcriptional regulator n=1 Tax=Actinoallomurus iriomotensis TaxID=478107 RepID=UPI0025542A43|nr:winged helix-turn-helix transcriptional regulator [Actinoallomurus iriomotensis]